MDKSLLTVQVVLPVFWDQEVMRLNSSNTFKIKIIYFKNIYLKKYLFKTVFKIKNILKIMILIVFSDAHCVQSKFFHKICFIEYFRKICCTMHVYCVLYIYVYIAHILQADAHLK